MRNGDVSHPRALLGSFSGHEVFGDLDALVLYIVSAPERTASARQTGDNGESSHQPTEDETRPCPSWPSQSRRFGTRWTYARTKPPSDNTDGNARLR